MKQGWKEIKMVDACEILTCGVASTPTYVDEKIGVPFLSAQNVRDGEVVLDKYSFISKEFHQKLTSKNKPSKGDILYSRVGAKYGEAGVVEHDFEFSVYVSVTLIRPKKELLNNYFLKNYLNSPKIKDLAKKSISSSGVPNLNVNSVRDFLVPIPPLPEQQRIVSILDEAFAAITKAKANAEQNLKNSKELFESYLQGVFENKGEGWEEKKLIEITNKIGSGATPRGGNESYKSEGISLVRSMNVHDFEFREKNLAFIDDQQAKELNNVTLQENDVLLNITGASVARCCVIPKEYLPARVNQHVSIIRAKKEIIDPIFLNLLLTSKFYKDQLLFTGEQGATRQAITKAQLEVFKIAFPKSIKEQKNLMNKLEALSTETKKLETIYQTKIKDLEELKKSLLQKAFSGELKIATALAV